MIALYAVGLFYATLIFYLAIMNIARAKDTLTEPQKVIFFPIAVVGVLLDITFRWTIGVILLADIRPCWMFTTVLQAHIKKDTWRGKVARFFCRHLLDQFDPSGSHCL